MGTGDGSTRGLPRFVPARRFKPSPQESWEMEQALERLRRSPNPDPATIRKVTLDLRARRFEVERVIAALPSLDEIGRTGRAGGPASARRPAGGGGPSAPGSTGGTT